MKQRLKRFILIIAILLAIIGVAVAFAFLPLKIMVATYLTALIVLCWILSK